MADFDTRLKAYRAARVAEDAHQLTEPAGFVQDYEDRYEELLTIRIDAMDALLLTPAKTLDQLQRKLLIIVTEQAHDNWHLSTPIMALVAEDAQRLAGEHRHA